MTTTASFRTLDDWLPWLESLSPREIVLGLERVDAVLDRIGLARPALVITITGTNGKGSSLAILEAILRKEGVRTGAYSSPHVHRYNERTLIDGVPADDATVIKALQTVEAARGDTPLTFFEFGTLASLVVFAKASVDAWLLEVGMGGRLDAVNAIDSDACLITNVSLDHCSWLGNDIESIATEKAGIMRANKPVVFGSMNVPDAIPRIAAETGAELILAGRDFAFNVDVDGYWCWQGRQHRINNLTKPLSGNFQYQNAAAVLALLEALGLSHALRPESISTALSDVRIEGRCQRLGQQWIVDVAHNPAAASVLADELGALRNGGEINIVVGMLDDKDPEGFIAPLKAVANRILAVSIGGERGSRANELARRIANASDVPCQIVPDLGDALLTIDRKMGEHDMTLVTGSFYIVGPAIRWIEQHSVAQAAKEQPD